MSVPINIPKLGVSMTEGTIVEWLVADGDQVTEGQALYVDRDGQGRERGRGHRVGHGADHRRGGRDLPRRRVDRRDRGMTVPDGSPSCLTARGDDGRAGRTHGRDHRRGQRSRAGDGRAHGGRRDAARPRRHRGRAARRARRAAGRRAAPTSITEQVDVSRAEDIERLADAAFERFGAVHVLCNNAGVVKRARAWDLTRRRLAVGARGRPVERDPRRAGLRAADAGPGRGWPHRQHGVDVRPAADPQPRRLQRRQVGGGGAVGGAAARLRRRGRADRRVGAVPGLHRHPHHRERAQPTGRARPTRRRSRPWRARRPAWRRRWTPPRWPATSSTRSATTGSGSSPTTPTGR